MTRGASRIHPACVLAVIGAALVMHGPGVLRGRALLPADVILLMRPWATVARERFPEFRFAQNQLLGPIFEYYSWRHYARSQMREGRVPLWNPYEMGGNVLLANSQSAVLYPPNVLLYLLPLWVGVNAVTLLHTVLTGLFMLGWLRALRLRHAGALAGALTWMLCATQALWTEFQTPTAALCWLPAALWASDAWIRRDVGTLGAVRGLLLSAAAVAMSLVAGHPQFAFYVVLAVVMYAGVRGCSVWGWRGAGVPVAAVGLALAFSAATLLPVGEAARINHRDRNATFLDSVRLRLPPVYLTSALLPNVRGNPRDYVRLEDGEPRPGHPYIGSYDFTEYGLYVGIPALLLSVLGLAWGWRARGTQEIALLGMIGLALALGTPVGALFFYLVPGYAQFHAPARALCLVHFALAALAGVGANAVLNRVAENGLSAAADPRLKGAMVASALVGVVAAASWPLSAIQAPVILSGDWMAYEAAGIRHAVVFVALTAAALWVMLGGKRTESAAAGNARRGKGDHGLSRNIRVAGLPIAMVVWALPALCALDLLIWGWGYNPTTDPAILEAPPDAASIPTPETGARAISFESPDLGIKGLIVPNYNAVVGYREVQGADSVHTRRYHRAMETVAEALADRRPAFPDGNTVRLPLGHHPLFDLMNVTHATTAPSAGPPAPEYTLLSEGLLKVWNNPSAAGPGRIVHSVDPVGGVEDAVRRLAEPGHSWRRTAVVEGSPPALGSEPVETFGTSDSVRLLTFGPHRVEYEAVTQQSGLLVTAEVAYPGWKATVSGRPAPILVADGIFRAVSVPDGASRVAFAYDPASFRVGLYISCFVLAASVGTLSGLWLSMGWHRAGRP
ncbi:MAG: YfhO family protein [Chthonomonadales bacterium]|nr:YfhO family protein [Chthonomonadales bacterium]